LALVILAVQVGYCLVLSAVGIIIDLCQYMLKASQSDILLCGYMSDEDWFILGYMQH
jgi:hypothetical protein